MKNDFKFVDGKNYPEGKGVPDLGSWKAIDVNRNHQRHYIGKDNDIEKLPTYVGDGSTARTVDTGRYFEFLGGKWHELDGVASEPASIATAEEVQAMLNEEFGYSELPEFIANGGGTDDEIRYNIKRMYAPNYRDAVEPYREPRLNNTERLQVIGAAVAVDVASKFSACLRLQCEIDEKRFEPGSIQETGTIILPCHYLGSDRLEIGKKYSDGKKTVNPSNVKAIIYNYESDVRYYNATLSGARTDWDYAFRAYVIYTDAEGNQQTEYSDDSKGTPYASFAAIAEKYMSEPDADPEAVEILRAASAQEE